MKRLILEMGTGNDLYGEDYTKAACRAVQDAIHHSSLTLFRSLNLDHAQMHVSVTIAVQEPEAVDKQKVQAELPRGRATVQVVKGGINVHDPEAGTVSVIANAAIEAFYDIQDEEWILSART